MKPGGGGNCRGDGAEREPEPVDGDRGHVHAKSRSLESESMRCRFDDCRRASPESAGDTLSGAPAEVKGWDVGGAARSPSGDW